MYGDSPNSNNEYLDDQNDYENQYDYDDQKEEDEQIDSSPLNNDPLANIAPSPAKTEVITTKDDEL
jgi:hypothetical protein